LIGGDLILVYDTNISIAYKNKNGYYSKKCGSVFMLSNMICSFPLLEYQTYQSKDIFFKIKCPICGEVHSYNYSLYDFVKREITIGGCDITGNPIFFIGKEKKINGILDKYHEVSKSVYAMV
jgi:hypothetical protein